MTMKMNNIIYYFSNKVENKYKVYINYDICEIIINKIINNINKLINIKKNIEHKKNKLVNKKKGISKQSCQTSDIYVVSKIIDYENYLNKLLYDKKFKYNVLKKW